MDAETHELIAGYALDALDDDERVRAEELLAVSAEARDELRSLAEVTEALAAGAVGLEPPAALRDRIVAAARADGRVVVPFERPLHRRRPVVPLLSLAAAAAAILAIGLGVWGTSLRSDLHDTRAALGQQRRAAAVLADLSATDVALASGSGRLVIGGDGRAVLVVDGLAPAPQGRTYEVWVIENGRPRPAGLFAGGNGQEVVLVGEQVPDGAVVAVTQEPSGGVQSPTSDPLVASSPV